MTSLTPYLLLNGTCQGAMEFYQSCFGGELTATKVEDSAAKDHMTAVSRRRSCTAVSRAASAGRDSDARQHRLSFSRRRRTREITK